VNLPATLSISPLHLHGCDISNSLPLLSQNGILNVGELFARTPFSKHQPSQNMMPIKYKKDVGAHLCVELPVVVAVFMSLGVDICDLSNVDNLGLDVDGLGRGRNGGRGNRSG